MNYGKYKDTVDLNIKKNILEGKKVEDNNIINVNLYKLYEQIYSCSLLKEYSIKEIIDDIVSELVVTDFNIDETITPLRYDEDNNINKLIDECCNATNKTEYFKHRDKLIDIILERNSYEITDVNNLVSDFNKKYTNTSEEFKMFVNSMINEKLQEQTFNTIKNSIKQKLNEKFDELTDLDQKNKILTVKDKIITSKYNKETYVAECKKLIELNDNLS